VICAECDGDCAPECGRHPKGCIFGGPDGASYWTVFGDCELRHPGDIEAVTMPAWAVDATVEWLRAWGPVAA
jgi:hypothetical protein